MYDWGAEGNNLQRPLQYGCRTPADRTLCNHNIIVSANHWLKKHTKNNIILNVTNPLTELHKHCIPREATSANMSSNHSFFPLIIGFLYHLSVLL